MEQVATTNAFRVATGILLLLEGRRCVHHEPPEHHGRIYWCGMREMLAAQDLRRRPAFRCPWRWHQTGHYWPRSRIRIAMAVFRLVRRPGARRSPGARAPHLGTATVRFLLDMSPPLILSSLRRAARCRDDEFAQLQATPSTTSHDDGSPSDVCLPYVPLRHHGRAKAGSPDARRAAGAPPVLRLPLVYAILFADLFVFGRRCAMVYLTTATTLASTPTSAGLVNTPRSSLAPIIPRGMDVVAHVEITRIAWPASAPAIYGIRHAAGYDTGMALPSLAPRRSRRCSPGRGSIPCTYHTLSRRWRSLHITLIDSRARMKIRPWITVKPEKPEFPGPLPAGSRHVTAIPGHRPVRPAA